MMVLVLIIILVKPQRFIKREHLKSNKITLLISFAFIGFYAGFIQIGTGYLVVIALSLVTEFSLIKISAIKVLVAGSFFVLVSVATFIYYRRVNFVYGIALGSGNAIGAYIASHLALKNGDKIFKPILIIAVVGMSIKLSGIYKLFL